MNNRKISMQNEMIADILKSEYSEIYGVDLEGGVITRRRKKKWNASKMKPIPGNTMLPI